MAYPTKRRSQRRIAFLERVKKWMLENPDASIAATMRATLATQGTVATIRAELIKDGLWSPRPHTNTRDRKTQDAEAGPTQSTREILTADQKEIERLLDGSAPLPREVRRKKLEALIVHGQPDHIIRANESIERMERQDVAPEDIGPPSPQSLDEAIEQTSDVIEALAAWGGEDAVRKAVTQGLERHAEDQKLVQASVTVQPDLMGATES